MTDYQLRVKIAARGAETTTVPSVSGHMWVELVDTVNGTVKSFGLAPKDAGNPTGVGKVYTNDSEHYKEVYYTETFDLSKAQYDRTLGFANNSVKNPPYYSVLSWEKGNHCIEYSYAFMRVSGVLPDTLGFSTGNMNEPRVFSHEGGGAIPQFHTQKIKDFKYFYELSKNKDTYDGETDLYGIKINYFTDPANSQLTVRNNADGSYSHITKDAVYTYYDKTSGNAFTSRIEISSGNEKHTVYYSQKYNILTKTYDTSYFTNYKGGSYLINLSGDDKAIENFVIQNGKSILQNNIVIEYTVDAQNKTESYNRIIVKQDMLKSFSNTGVAVQHSGTNKTLSGEAWIAIKDTATIIIDGATYTAGAIVEASQVAYEALEQFAKNTVSSTVLTSSMNTALNATFTYIGTNYNNLNTLNVLKTFATAYGIANISTSITQTDLVKQIGHAINGTQLKASNGTWLKNTNGVELHTLNPEGYGGAIVNGLIGFGVTAVAFGNDWNSGDFATNGQTEIVNAIATEYVASSFDITQADASGIVAITSVVIRNLIANPSMNTSDIAGVAVQAAIAYSSYAVGSAVTAYFASAGLAFGGPIGALVGGLTGAVLGSVTKGLYKQPYYSDGEFATLESLMQGKTEGVLALVACNDNLPHNSPQLCLVA